MSSDEFDSSENDSVMTDDDSNWNSFELDTESELDEEYAFDSFNFVEIDPNPSTKPPSKFQFRSEPGVHVANDNNDVLEYFEYYMNNEVANLLYAKQKKYANYPKTTYIHISNRDNLRL